MTKQLARPSTHLIQIRLFGNMGAHLAADGLDSRSLPTRRMRSSPFLNEFKHHVYEMPAPPRKGQVRATP